MNDLIAPLIAQRTQLPEKGIRKAIGLMAEGATIPFISRYRKEATGSLDELALENIRQEWTRFQELLKRKETIRNTIEEQGKLSPELNARIEQCWNPVELEDLYLPYKPRRKTRGSMAREKGLEPLARTLFRQDHQDPEQLAKAFLKEDVPDTTTALQGARDIIAEWINEDERARQITRTAFRRNALLVARVARGKESEGAKYKDYFDYSEPLKKCPSHRLLAIRRGEAEGFLRVSITPDPEETQSRLGRHFLKGNGACSRQVGEALEDAYKRLLQPAIETEFRNSSKEQADVEAIRVFADNLRQLLLAPPLGQQRTMGIDPGFRSGCKVVCLDEKGDLLYHTTVFPHPPQKEEARAADLLVDLVGKYGLTAIAVGNGTAGRETLSFCRQQQFPHPVEIFLVNEAGASIYSASELAREEFPDKDVTVRGAVSIGRRLMDPLAELVKLDAKNIGVGQYQHDVNQMQLKDSLDRTVESCVNTVGINLNTASQHLLTYVSGLGPVLAQNIVEYRKVHGPFSERKELLEVPRLGAKAFEQSAGFLRIRNGKDPLDNTAVHPESYYIVGKMARDLGCSSAELITRPDLRKAIRPERYTDERVGLPTLKDILQELEKPGLDPRGKARPFEFGNVHNLDDLREGMTLPGIVTNLTNFGAFIDIGVKQDGLVHISEIANRFVRNPADELKLGQEVRVKVVQVDRPRKRIQLSIKQAN